MNGNVVPEHRVFHWSPCLWTACPLNKENYAESCRGDKNTQVTRAHDGGPTPSGLPRAQSCCRSLMAVVSSETEPFLNVCITVMGLPSDETLKDLEGYEPSRSSQRWILYTCIGKHVSASPWKLEQSPPGW